MGLCFADNHAPPKTDSDPVITEPMDFMIHIVAVETPFTAGEQFLQPEAAPSPYVYRFGRALIYHKNKPKSKNHYLSLSFLDRHRRLCDGKINSHFLFFGSHKGD